MDEMRIVEALSKANLTTNLDNKPEFDDSKKKRTENEGFKGLLDEKMEILRNGGKL